ALAEPCPSRITLPERPAMGIPLSAGRDHALINQTVSQQHRDRGLEANYVMASCVRRIQLAAQSIERHERYTRELALEGTRDGCLAL
ncbi:MAG TPA: hypothetical protein VG963_14110, partial [Polyangiaceae bacterium]|nr:hypothetical protein [Polyangiaceae bacterium]